MRLSSQENPLKRERSRAKHQDKGLRKKPTCEETPMVEHYTKISINKDLMSSF